MTMLCGAVNAAWCGAVLGVTAILLQPASAEPDLELGRYLANPCLTCHRPSAKPGEAIPHIFSRDEKQLVELIRAYRDKKRPNPVMQTATAGLKDDEVEALAAYFARNKGP